MNINLLAGQDSCFEFGPSSQREECDVIIRLDSLSAHIVERKKFVLTSIPTFLNLEKIELMPLEIVLF